jgi:ATP-dependent RNA helicase DeaD
LIFCQTKALVTDLTERLKSNGYAVDCLHGDMEQNARERTMKAFKAKTSRVLICTDVASRGIDVKELTHVVNYSLPRELDLYVHRIGRTGRGGAEGLAFSMVSPSHMYLVNRIERATGSKMQKAQVPSDQDVLKVRLKRALDAFLEEPKKEQMSLKELTGALKGTDWSASLEDLSKEEIVARFLSKTMKAPEKKSAPATSGFASRYDRGDRADRGARFEQRGDRAERGERPRYSKFAPRKGNKPRFSDARFKT